MRGGGGGSGGGVIVLMALWAALAMGLGLLAATWTIHGVSAQLHCPSGFLACDDGECLRQAKFCDGPKDCKDGSDEKDCDAPCFPPAYFRCHNGRCIIAEFLCDGEDHCGDDSDELDCHEKQITPPRTCGSDEYRCADNFCVPAIWRCDGTKDCLDGSDETIGCEGQIECTKKNLFLCANHRCIPFRWRCDGVDDCEDNSDEQGCSSRTKPGIKEQCPIERGLYQCDEGTACSELAELCNGQKDCPDGSDEGQLCNSSKAACSGSHCGYRCIPSPKGPLCICPKGFNITRENTCKDIDECQEYGICSQKCKNTPGSYECQCDSSFKLKADNKSCLATGPNPLLVFSMKTEIRAMELRVSRYFSVIKGQQHVVGVDYDGIHMYWTSAEHGKEEIMRSREDGSMKEQLAYSGIGLPEDLAVDWLTGNIYYTDSEVKHIGVCTYTGKICTSLINEDINAPRAILLYIAKGLMFWTDWGQKPMVARAGMDGSSPIAFISKNLEWPGGLALDAPNERIYWLDSRLGLIESVKLDGTDRRIILDAVMSHPFALAVFENDLYWSDLDTDEILACNKFNGKNIRKIVYSRNNQIFGVKIYHPSLHPENMTNPCQDAKCSDICLLAPQESYTCACSEEKILNEDKHTCGEIKKKEQLAIGAGNKLIILTHNTLGKPDMTLETLHGISQIGALAYDKIRDVLFISDIGNKQIKTLNMKNDELHSLLSHEIGIVVGLSYDHLADNLYWCDAELRTIEVMSLSTKLKRVLLRTLGIPLDLIVVPEHSVMFVAFRDPVKEESYHIDKMHMDGTGVLHFSGAIGAANSSTSTAMEFSLLGPIALTFDEQLKELIYADSGRGSIEACEMDGSHHRILLMIHGSPISIKTLERDLFWTTAENSSLYWSDKRDQFPKIKILPLEILNNENPKVLQSLRGTVIPPDHVCRTENGGCSDICLVSQNAAVCVCSNDKVLQSDSRTCATPIHCGKSQYKCEKENRCISALLRCNGHADCVEGEDELDCPTPCLPHQFECDNGQCIKAEQHCDNKQQCTDGSDEFNCHDEKCNKDEFKCSSGECIQESWICNFHEDCEDGSDEGEFCYNRTCATGKFRCKSGNCISAFWECDHDLDCPDGSDEHEGCPPIRCASEDFQCGNLHCIDHTLKCNGQDDCLDGSDEVDCATESGAPKPINCAHNEFKCTAELDLCLPQEARCNGSAECPRAEDELGCGCSIHQFECDVSKCIDESWVCDGIVNCEDKSDEDPSKCFPNQVPCLGFRCVSGQCVELHNTCDGIYHCNDQSDEGGVCATACNHGNPCEDICNPTPNGPVCSCHPGFAMRAETTTCVDIDECSENLCSQICENTPGSFICSCAAGYALRFDRMSCKAIGESMKILFVANGNEIRMAPFSLKTLQILHHYSGTDIVDLDLHFATKSVYWSTGRGQIFNTSLSEKETTSVPDLGNPRKIAVDWITNNIYFSDGGKIKVCSLESRKCAPLIKAESGAQIENLIINPFAGYIFWTERIYNNRGEPEETIKRADLSGSNSSPLVKDLSVVEGMAIDFVHGLLFWLDVKEEIVGAVGYRGEGRHIVFNKVQYASGLSFYEDSLYWISTDTGRLTKCRAFGHSKPCEWVQLNSYNVKTFVLMQQQLQKMGENSCLKKVCSHLCTSGATEPKCICPHGEISEESGCPENASSLIPAGNKEEKEVNGSSTTIVAIIFIVILLVLLFLLAYYFRKRIQIRPPDLSTAVHYITNPYSTLWRSPGSRSTPQKPLEEEEEMEVVCGETKQTPKLESENANKTLQLLDSDEEADLSETDTAKLIP